MDKYEYNLKLDQIKALSDWTAQRMIGYLSHYKKLPMEEIADEMLAILSDRNRIMQKHELEETNARWNEYLNRQSQEDSHESTEYRR